MKEKLDHLAKYLQLSNLEEESSEVLKLAGFGVTHLNAQQQAQNTLENGLHGVLDLIGLIPVYGEAADFANAAIYLSKGITDENLLMAGLSIVSMVPELGDTSKVIKYGEKLAPALTKQIAQLIFKHQGKVKAIFDRFKDPKVIAMIHKYVPKGDLLVKHSDQIWAVVRNWFLKIIDDQVKAPIQNIIQPNAT